MKKYLKITLLVIIAIILVGTFVFLYQKSKPKVIVYETLAAEVTDLEKTTVATGKVEPRDEILIKPQISGIVDEVFKEAGQSVKKGEVIAKVKVIPELGQLNSAESRVRLAEINAKQAETDFTRIKKLYEDQLISREDYEKGEVAVSSRFDTPCVIPPSARASFISRESTVVKPYSCTYCQPRETPACASVFTVTILMESVIASLKVVKPR